MAVILIRGQSDSVKPAITTKFIFSFGSGGGESEAAFTLQASELC